MSGAIGEAILHTDTADEVLEQVLEARKDLSKHYQLVKDKKAQFWLAFQEQYLETLRFTQDKMGNSYKNTPNIGDICLVYDQDEPRHRWKLAVILSRVLSKDGLCRSCVIKTEHRVTSRPTNFLFKLEMELDEEHQKFLIETQASRAAKHSGPVAELKNTMREEAKKSNLPKQDIDVILNKLTDDPETQITLERPKRSAAIKAAALRKQMVKDNII